MHVLARREPPGLVRQVLLREYVGPSLPLPGLETAHAFFAGALEDKLAHLTVDQRKALEKDLAKKEKKEEAKAEKEKAKMSVRCFSASPSILAAIHSSFGRAVRVSLWSLGMPC